MKDLQTRRTLLRCESAGDLYPLPASFNKPSSASSTALLVSSLMLWHKRLGHTNEAVLRSLSSSNSFPYNKEKFPNSCPPCFLGKQIKLPFHTSKSVITEPFEIVHSHVWTSPIPSMSGIRYYVLFLDHFTQFLWVYHIRKKSEVFSKFLHFSSYVKN